MEDTFGKLNFQAITFAYFRSQTTMEKAATFPSEKKKIFKDSYVLLPGSQTALFIVRLFSSPQHAQEMQ